MWKLCGLEGFSSPTFHWALRGPGLGVASEATADPEDAASYYQGLVTASAGRSDEAAKKDPTGDLQLG